MENLHELVSFLNKTRVQRIEVLGNAPGKRGRAEEFYEKLLEKDFDNDEEAAKYFFGEDTTAKDRRYQQLKERLYDKMLNTVFFVDANRLKFNAFQRTYYELVRDVAAAKILLNRTYYKNARHILKRSLKRAKHYEFTDIHFEILYLLKIDSGLRLFNKKKFEQYAALLNECDQLRKVEHIAEDYYALATMGYYEDRSNLKSTYQRCKAYFEELEGYLDQYNSIKLTFMTRFIELMMHSSNRDFENILKTCRTAIDALSARRHTHPGYIGIFFIEKSTTCLQLGRYEEGIATVQESLSIWQPKSPNWSSSLHTLFLLYFHSDQYKEAYQLVKKVMHPKVMDRMLVNTKESWIIAEGYTEFLIEIGYINVPNKKKFRIPRFINQLPEASRDKRVTNVPILILETLFYIARKKYDKSIDKMSSITRYTSRYLLRDNTFRSNCFIKMLLCIPTANFNRIATERRAEKLRKRLSEAPIIQIEQTHEVEYIPYEKLWDMTLELLDNSHYSV